MQEETEEKAGDRKRAVHYNSGLGLHVLNHWCMSFMSLRLHTAWKIRPAARILRHSECHF